MANRENDSDEKRLIPKALEWGQTPWDELPREQLLQEAQLMHAAIEALYAELHKVASAATGSTYYTDGAGGRALAKGAAILERSHGFDALFQSFFGLEKRGQTPWDDLSREQLLREAQRMYSALESLYTELLHKVASSSTRSTYYTEGMGARALAQGTAILSAIEREYEPEALFHSFFRYADQLLFADINHRFVGAKWAICPNRHMSGGPGTDEHAGHCTACGEPTRPIEWRDFQTRRL